MERWQGQSAEIRFFRHVNKSPKCWEWIGGKKKAGYGQFAVNGKKTIAHRWAYQHFVGAIPDHYEIDHLCHNPSCVNPEHLEAVTLRENRDRRNARKTHCPYNHIYDEANTRMQRDSNGYLGRVCRICERRRNKESVTRRKLNA